MYQADGETKTAHVSLTGGGFGLGAAVGQASVSITAGCPEDLKGKELNLWFVAYGAVAGGINGGGIGGSWLWMHVE